MDYRNGARDREIIPQLVTGGIETTKDSGRLLNHARAGRI